MEVLKSKKSDYKLEFEKQKKSKEKYSRSAFFYGLALAKRLEKNIDKFIKSPRSNVVKAVDYLETNNISYRNISGRQHDIAISMLSEFWKYGKYMHTI